MSKDRGELAIVLHTHMPYVEGFGTWPFGEEWLLEAMAASYLPLIRTFERWRDEGRSGVVTVGVTPVLADQLVLPEVGRRFLSFMRGVRREGHRLDAKELESGGQPEAAAVLRASARAYEWAADYFELLGADIVGSLGQLQDGGVIELWTSAATHAVLPLLATEVGTRLQVKTGVDSHRQRFKRWSGGFWLPECAYRPGLEDELGAAGVRTFCVDQTRSAGKLDQLTPIATSGGPVAMPIDWETISLVWNDRGYPAHAAYRDYHAHSTNGLWPYANGGDAYRAETALGQARRHARDFVTHVVEKLERFLALRGNPGLVVCALDTELLGHWWHEGPAWLAAVVEEAQAANLPLVTLPDALEHHPVRHACLSESSWGSSKDLSTWDSREVAEFVWTARASELALVGAAERARVVPEIEAVAPHDAGVPTARAVRELLALQASDWAFMASRQLAGHYPHTRLRDHAAAFGHALARLDGFAVEDDSVKDSRKMPRRPNSEQSPQSPRTAKAELDGFAAALGGLAPSLGLSTLLEPSSPAWGHPPGARER